MKRKQGWGEKREKTVSTIHKHKNKEVKIKEVE
jgi:hypothetical protein